MRHPRTHGFCLALAMLAACLATGELVAQTRSEQEKQREQWQRVTDIFRAMEVRPGAAVADVGAGDGFFTTRLASAVGPTGQVFAVDVSDAQTASASPSSSDSSRCALCIGLNGRTASGTGRHSVRVCTVATNR
jgi:predicted methyltransferase